jgi:hypothetical protein
MVYLDQLAGGTDAEVQRIGSLGLRKLRTVEQGITWRVMSQTDYGFEGCLTTVLARADGTGHEP